ncbi:hypothetical protein [Arthrobacter rhizosphaerae]|nr:hypothetical protein [Arthrobacter rhizosphaerae]
MDLTRYTLGLAVLLGVMVLSLLCAHLLFRWALHREHRGRKLSAPEAAD